MTEPPHLHFLGRAGIQAESQRIRRRRQALVLVKSSTSSRRNAPWPCGGEAWPGRLESAKQWASGTRERSQGREGQIPWGPADSEGLPWHFHSKGEPLQGTQTKMKWSPLTFSLRVSSSAPSTNPCLPRLQISRAQRCGPCTPNFCFNYYLWKILNQDWTFEDFPSGPVAKTLRSQCRGPAFDPGSGNKIPQDATKDPTGCREDGRSYGPQLRPGAAK